MDFLESILILASESYRPGKNIYNIIKKKIFIFVQYKISKMM